MTDVAHKDTADASNAPAQRRTMWRGLIGQPLACFALVIVVGISVAAIFADALAPFDPLEQDLTNILSWPGMLHPLGTDDLGRDTLSRLLHGGRPALIGVLVACLVFLVLGMAFGVVAGYFGGAVDRIIGTIVDILMSLPGVVLVFTVLAIFAQNLTIAMITFGILVSGSLTRIVRATVLAFRGELYVKAATVSGLGPIRIMFRHVLPGLAGPVTVQVSLFAGLALGVQTGLGFLGLASPPPSPSWGGMVGDAASTLGQTPMLLLASGGTIAVMMVAFALLGEGIRDASNDVRKGVRSRTRLTVPAPIPEDSSDAVLDVHDLTIGLSLRGGGCRKLVNEVSLTVNRGEILGLVGESGSGKTLISLSLLGLLPEGIQVLSGGACLDGDALTQRLGREWRPIRGRRIGLVSQEPMNALNPLFTIGTHLDDTLRALTGLARRARHARALELLDAVHLSNPEKVLRCYPHELSGGMIQRVVIAIALAGDPELLIADEPTTALDVTVQAEILDLLRRMRDERELAVILVTHDLGVVADICDRAVVLQDGVVVEEASVERLFDNPTHDYTRRLIASTPRLLEVDNAV